MSSIVTTITSKWQVTIPEGVRKELALEIGQQISWDVQGDKLVGRKVRSISELAGCLKAEARAGKGENSQRAFASAVMARHDRISK